MEDLSTSLHALPVAVDTDPGVRDPLKRHLEGVLGWQVVDPTTAALVPPVVRFVDGQRPSVDDGVPRVLVVDADRDVLQVARAVSATVPHAIIGWPSERDQLPATVEAAIDAIGAVEATGRVVRVGGAAGGVGTSTVALALAGLAAWDGLRSLAVMRGHVPVRDPVDVTSGAIGALDLFSRARIVDGVGGLRVVRVVDDSRVADPMDPAIEMSIIDQGVDADVDVIVVRPDASALDVVPVTTASTVIVVGSGPVAPRQIAEVAAGRRGVAVPTSNRVARAGFERRVPAGLPGAWLRRLEGVVPDEDTVRVVRHGIHRSS